MDEHMNNVGGQSMGMAKSVAGQLQNDSRPAASYGASAAPQPTDSYAQQPNDVARQATQISAEQQGVTGNQNNNNVINATVPNTAEDSDLIEKEWVEKAKAIVEKTRRDPYLQSQELNRFKMEYLQKRYGKNVGSDEA